MDLNFLIFPKPEFTGPTDLFYSRLLLVPNRGIRVKSITSKKAAAHKEEIQQTEIDRFKVNSDMEGTPLYPRVIVKRSFDSIRGRPPLFSEEVAIEDSCVSKESPTIQIQAVRAIDKSVRLPKSPILQKEFVNPAFPMTSEMSPPKRMPLNINLQSNRPQKRNSTSNVTLSKLMCDLDSYKLKKPSGINLKTQIDSKFLMKKIKKIELSPQKQSPRHSKQDFDPEELLDDFAAPSEHHLGKERDDETSNTAIVKSFFQRRSLNQLNKMFPKSGDRLFSEFQAPYLHTNIKSSVKSPGPKLLIKSSADKNRNNPMVNKIIDPLDENTNLHSAQSKVLAYNKSPFKLSLKGRTKEGYKQSLFSMKGCNLRSSNTGMESTHKVQIQNEAAKIKNLINQGMNEHDSIPCLVTPPSTSSSTVILYFHANGEDIHQIQGFCEMLQISFHSWVVAMEYPGYSVYRSEEISEEKIIRDGETVLNYINQQCNVSLDRVLIMGRSLGSGPACFLSTRYPVKGLVLVSPFTSIKDLAKEHYGLFGKLLIKDRFNNLENIRKITCPIMIIHGVADTLVPLHHAKTLQGMALAEQTRVKLLVYWSPQIK